MGVGTQLQRARPPARASRRRPAGAEELETLPGAAAELARAALAVAAPAAALRPEHVMSLQQTAGNAAVTRLVVARRTADVTAQRAGGGARRVRIPEGALPSSRLGRLGTPAETAFRRRVYQRQLERSARDPTKEFLDALPEDELEEVEDGQQMAKGTVAEEARKLLAAARADLATARASARRGAAVRTVTSIGIDSAYRGLRTELGAWQRAYRTAFNATKGERQALEGGELGDAAVGLMARRMYDYKAIPGYSRHTKGLAIDFMTRQGGVRYGPNGSQKDAWTGTWLYRWLVAHAAEYGFEPYSAEPWHWQHAPVAKTPGEGAEAAAD
ncbi:MAG: hypothetical protein H6Q36_1799 [Chloroflexi bacterium]|nr:hypothetical protein [Chloroflexota bacterium]